MTLKYKDFMLPLGQTPFLVTVLNKIVQTEHPKFVANDRLAVQRFRDKFNKESQFFQERAKELAEPYQKTLEEFQGSEEDKEALSKKNDEEFMKHIVELLDCDSLLKPLNYEAVQHCSYSILDQDVLDRVMINKPVED